MKRLYKINEKLYPSLFQTWENKDKENMMGWESNSTVRNSSERHKSCYYIIADDNNLG